MRYQILKFMSKHPVAILNILILIINIILIYTKSTVGVVLGAVTLVYYITIGSYFMTGVEMDHKVFKKVMKKMNFNKYEKRYRKNDKILKEIYTYKLEKLSEETSLLFEPTIRDAALEMDLDMRSLNKWCSYMQKNPLELKKTSNKEVFEKFYQASESLQRLYDSCEYDTEANWERNAIIVLEDIERLCDDAKKAFENKYEFKSIYEETKDEINAKQSTKYLISCVNSILQKNIEFTETVQKLERIQKIIPEEEISAKFKIVLENMIICSEKFEKSRDDSYQSEFRKLITNLNKYLDKILKGEEEAIAMEDIATVKALSDFISE